MAQVQLIAIDFHNRRLEFSDYIYIYIKVAKWFSFILDFETQLLTCEIQWISGVIEIIDLSIDLNTTQ